MKINKLHEISFDTNDTIITSTLSKPNELVMLLSSGSVIKYDLESQKEEQLFSIKNDIVYPDGGFDTAAKSSIYTLDDIVVVVNDYKRHGFIHNPEKYYTLHLWREDYHADISCYPITLYKNKINIPHIIYGVAWNHVQIMNLDTRQILTASKSLIEENAEENYKYVIEKCGEHNKLPWPLPYDYFFGKLQISPNGEYFLSAGWGWGSCDLYKIYNIGYFLNSNRISDISIGGWGHENRAVCWIDDNTIAVTYNPFTEGDDNSDKDSANEIHIYTLSNHKIELTNKIKITKIDIITTEISYNKYLNSFIIFSDNLGVAVISLTGEILYHNSEFKVNNYFAQTNLFLTTKSKSVEINQIII